MGKTDRLLVRNGDDQAFGIKIRLGKYQLVQQFDGQLTNKRLILACVFPDPDQMRGVGITERATLNHCLILRLFES
jgi:hypothetical protein